MGTFMLILGIVLFLSLVIIHELGHFWVAKRNGVKPEEFGVFFPPRLWKKRMKGGWDFSVNLLPLGGFVKLKGEHDSDTAKGSFGAATDRAKAKIMLAGVALNLVTALGLFTVLAWTGMPNIPALINNQFTVKSDTKVIHRSALAGLVEPGSPAAKAGLQRLDDLKTISNGQKTVTIGDTPLSQATKQFAGQTVTVRYNRQGDSKAAKITLLSAATVEASRKTSEPKGYLGIVPFEYSLQRSTWSAPIVAVGLTVQMTKMTLAGLWNAVQGLGGIIAGAVTGNTAARQNAQTEASSQVSGPVGIFMVLKEMGTLGMPFLLFIIAIISLTLAIMNVLPIPALDGGRLYLMLASRLTKAKRLTPDMEEKIVGASFLLLLGLIVLITIVDVRRFF
ncbi:site-2 protease family protein [Candidatus Saccharibacteria bacterium]|nr:site-2 protease family protein [Candidatus Saccharibacteria bacterium]